MRRARTSREGVLVAALILTAAGCNVALDLAEGRPKEPECAELADCVVAEPECAGALGCVDGRCVFEYRFDGWPLSTQAAGDCREFVCDGAGGVRMVSAPSDVADDDNPCTIDACMGTTPTHEPGAYEVPCYTGPKATRNVGACREGRQQCSANGEEVGDCEGEVLPASDESCFTPEDDDCNGSLESPTGEGCLCGNGVADAAMGEECDDGGTDDGDQCSPTCRIQRVLRIATGGTSGHTCALLTGGVFKCWGDNTYGQLGLGDYTDHGYEADDMGKNLSPVDLGTGVSVASFAEGSQHSCAVLSSGKVKCWGANGYGQLGLGTNQPFGTTPLDMGDNLPVVDLGGAANVEQVALGVEHTCAILGGHVKCWGANYLGQLGLGDTQSRGNVPGQMGDVLAWVDLGASLPVVSLALGAAHSCALILDGSVKCWGANQNGQLGLGDTVVRGDNANEMGNSLPAVDLGDSAVAISAGAHHTCALLSTNEVKCWGLNSFGQLGLGDTQSRGDNPGEMGVNLSIVDMGVAQSVTAVAAGGFHTCALLTDGSSKCWGRNNTGQLGVGDTQTRGDGPNEMGAALPTIDIGAGKTASGLSAGVYHACALLWDGSAKCWGANSNGELGLGDVFNRGTKPTSMGDNLPTVKLFSDFW